MNKKTRIFLIDDDLYYQSIYKSGIPYGMKNIIVTDRSGTLIIDNDIYRNKITHERFFNNVYNIVIDISELCALSFINRNNLSEEILSSYVESLIIKDGDRDRLHAVEGQCADNLVVLYENPEFSLFPRGEGAPCVHPSDRIPWSLNLTYLLKMLEKRMRKECEFGDPSRTLDFFIHVDKISDISKLKIESRVAEPLYDKPYKQNETEIRWLLNEMDEQIASTKRWLMLSIVMVLCLLAYQIKQYFLGE